MTGASDQTAVAFVEAEFRRLMMPDDSLIALCRSAAQTFLPDRREAAPIIAALLKTRLIKGVPTSLIRIGNSEGNALGMMRGTVHSIQFETFNAEFFDQVGARLDDDEARTL